MKKRDSNFPDTIIKEELDGVFAFAIEGLKRLVHNEYRFTQSKKVKNMLTSYRRDVNPLLQFVQDCIVSVDKKEEWEDLRIHHDILFYAHRLWEEEQGNSPGYSPREKTREQKRKFTMAIKNTLDSEGIYYSDKESGSTGAYYYGIALAQKMQSMLRNSQNPDVRKIIKEKKKCGVA